MLSWQVTLSFTLPNHPAVLEDNQFADHFSYLLNPRFWSAFLIMWRPLYFSSSIEDMIMQKCKLQFDQNKRINSKQSNLTPPFWTACSSFPLCPGPEQILLMTKISNSQIMRLAGPDNQMIKHDNQFFFCSCMTQNSCNFQNTKH